MKKLDLLRKIIREEVAKAIREEVPKVLKEISSSPTDYKKNIQEQIKKRSSFPLTLNEEVQKSTPKFDTKSPLGKILNETAISMTTDDVFSFSGKASIESENDSSSGATVGDMLARARKSSQPEMVQIDTVPDFTGMMDKLKNKGLL